MAGLKSLSDQEVRDTIATPSEPIHPSPQAWEDQVLYFLLPDRFSNGEEDIDGGETRKYDPAEDKNNAISTDSDAANWRHCGLIFNGGTLNGLRSKLPYIKNLGVTALWVGPLFRQIRGRRVNGEWEIQTYHGYAVQDFLDVDPRFGTREELRDLVKTAHEMGIYVLLDIILNHTGNVFEYSAGIQDWYGGTYDVNGFYDSDHHGILPMSAVDDDSKFPDAAIWPKELQNKNCFTRKGRIKSWDNFPEFTEGDFSDLKDLALGNPDADDFHPGPVLPVMCKVYKYWIAYANLDGYRIDTVKHMGDGPTRYFANVIHEYAASIGKERFLLIGEITGSRAYDTVETTGIDAALGIGNVQASLWQVPKGIVSPSEYFDLFRNALYLNKGSHTWFRDKVVTMIDDHDQVWKGKRKERYCYDELGQKTIEAALGLNLLTLGIPCIYYGTEQSFDGEGWDDDADRYIREAMFGGEFGPFRSKDRHCFDDNSKVYKAVRDICEVRSQEMALRRGRQYLREISGDGEHFGYPTKCGTTNIKSIVAWSRLFADEEILCAINSDTSGDTSAWVTLDREAHPPESTLKLLYPVNMDKNNSYVSVKDVSGRSAALIRVPVGGIVIYK